MKKKIEFANLTSSLASWLLEKLKAAPLDVGNIDEFKEGIEGLLDGSNNSLMLEIDDDTVYEEHCFDVIEIGDLTIRPKERRVLYNTQEISLTPKEYDILLFLVKNRGEVLTKEQIYQAVWDSEYLLDDSNIMAFIRKLRKKIEPNPDAPIYILTIWGIGYKFNDKAMIALYSLIAFGLPWVKRIFIPLKVYFNKFNDNL